MPDLIYMKTKLINSVDMLSELKPLTEDMKSYAMLISDVRLMMQNWVERQEIIDPVYAAGGCYCKECLLSSESEKLRDNMVFCWYFNAHMDEKDFCSRGIKKKKKDKI